MGNKNSKNCRECTDIDEYLRNHTECECNSVCTRFILKNYSLRTILEKSKDEDETVRKKVINRLGQTYREYEIAKEANDLSSLHIYLEFFSQYNMDILFMDIINDKMIINIRVDVGGTPFVALCELDGDCKYKHYILLKAPRVLKVLCKHIVRDPEPEEPEISYEFKIGEQVDVFDTDKQRWRPARVLDIEAEKYEISYGYSDKKRSSKQIKQIKQEKISLKQDIKDLEVGDLLDVKDTVNKWLKARIKKNGDDDYYIHYEGWPNRWDEWISKSSPRLALLGTHTGQSRTNTPFGVIEGLEKISESSGRIAPKNTRLHEWQERYVKAVKLSPVTWAHIIMMLIELGFKDRVKFCVEQQQQQLEREKRKKEIRETEMTERNLTQNRSDSSSEYIKEIKHIYYTPVSPVYDFPKLPDIPATTSRESSEGEKEPGQIPNAPVLYC